MFWGLIMEPKRRYTQKVKHPFHISMAALDIFSADDEPTQLMLYFEERNYLLCTLQKGHTVQCPLSLNFEAGDEVVFATNGHSNVHLSGYLQDDYMNVEEGEEEDEEEEEDNELTLETKNKKRKVGKNETQPPKKKSKLEQLLDQTYDSDDDDSFALPDSAEEEESSADDAEEEESAEEEEDDEVFDGLEEKEESDEDVSSMSDDDDEEEEEEEEVKPKQNGVLSKRQKKLLKQKQAQQNEQKQSPKATNKTPKGEKTPKADKTPGKQQKADNAQKNKTPKGEKTPKGDKTPNQKEAKTPASPNQQGTPQRRTLEGGVVVQDLKVGDGQTVKSGKIIQVYYEGRLKQNNKVFDQNSKGSGFKFRLGKQEVIKGWDVGVVGMKTGGKRRIICPPNMAYGNKGSPPVIPPNSTLVFDVELKNIL